MLQIIFMKPEIMKLENSFEILCSFPNILWEIFFFKNPKYEYLFLHINKFSIMVKWYFKLCKKFNIFIFIFGALFHISIRVNGFESSNTSYPYLNSIFKKIQDFKKFIIQNNYCFEITNKVIHSLKLIFIGY